MNLNQFDETCSAQTVIIHQPGLEVFMSMLHPAASLYRNVTSNSELNSNYNQLKKILQKRKIKLLSVRECLKINRIEIEKLALKSLSYVAENPTEGILSSEFDYFMSDHYKQSNLNKPDSDQLVDVILTQPTFRLRYTNINTNVEFVDLFQTLRKPDLC